MTDNPPTPAAVQPGAVNRPSMEEIHKRLGNRGGRVVEGGAKPLPATPDAGRPERKLPEAGSSSTDFRRERFDSMKNRPPMKIVSPGKSPSSDARVNLEQVKRQRFSERVNTGDLAHLTKGAAAEKLQLGEQYRLHEKGDVARQLGLHKRMSEAGPDHLARNQYGGRRHQGGGDPPAPSPAVHGPRHGGDGYKHHHPPHHFPHRGPISVNFVNFCFQTTYCGPGYYPHTCWYPRWSPWVAWSWHYHCHPLWDPRPLWCRPVVYVVAPVWTYWTVPVWTPLPVVACGTWVDVPPVVVAQPFDLQLLAVRFVDPGHPEENLGPRYRVWFRNNSSQPIARPFNVTLLASVDDHLKAGLPQAGTRVTSIEANDIQSVDIRLPVEVNGMAREADGAQAPFNTLHVLVDADREIDETSRTNNGVTIARTEILPADPAAFEVQPVAAAAGQEVLLAGEGFGPEPGQVLIHLGGIEMQGEIQGWYDLGVKLALPNLPLAAPTEAELIVVRGDGAAANPLKITIGPR